MKLPSFGTQKSRVWPEERNESENPKTLVGSNGKPIVAKFCTKCGAPLVLDTTVKPTTYNCSEIVWGSYNSSEHDVHYLARPKSLYDPITGERL